MTKEEILKQIDTLRDELLRLSAKESTLAETIAICQQRQDRIRQRRREIHEEVNTLKIEILKG